MTNQEQEEIDINDIMIGYQTNTQKELAANKKKGMEPHDGDYLCFFNDLDMEDLL